jgi:hypothetical protein
MSVQEKWAEGYRSPNAGQKPICIAQEARSDFRSSWKFKSRREHTEKASYEEKLPCLDLGKQQRY